MNIINERPKSPCVKECEFRTAVCKCECELYKEYESKYSVYIKQKEKNIAASNELSDYKKGIIQKQLKRRRKS